MEETTNERTTNIKNQIRNRLFHNITSFNLGAISKQLEYYKRTNDSRERDLGDACADSGIACHSTGFACLYRPIGPIEPFITDVTTEACE